MVCLGLGCIMSNIWLYCDKVKRVWLQTMLIMNLVVLFSVFFRVHCGTT